LVFFQKILEKLYGEAETELFFGSTALFFDTMLHVGTLVAVFAVLWNDIWAILKRIFQPLTAFLIIATIPTVIFALIFKKPLEQAFESGRFLGFYFFITSFLLIMAEFLAKRAANKANNAATKDEVKNG
jgi:undecaprenyl-diphosphatase